MTGQNERENANKHGGKNNCEKGRRHTRITKKIIYMMFVPLPLDQRPYRFPDLCFVDLVRDSMSRSIRQTKLNQGMGFRGMNPDIALLGEN